MVEDDSDDEYSESVEGHGEENIVVVDVDQPVDIANISEGVFCVVEYKADKGKMIYYVCKVIGVDGVDVTVSTLRRSGARFVIPHIPDVNVVAVGQIRFRLPAPSASEGTARQKTYYCFANVIFPDVELR